MLIRLHQEYKNNVRLLFTPMTVESKKAKEDEFEIMMESLFEFSHANFENLLKNNKKGTKVGVKTHKFMLGSAWN